MKFLAQVIRDNILMFLSELSFFLTQLCCKPVAYFICSRPFLELTSAIAMWIKKQQCVCETWSWRGSNLRPSNFTSQALQHWTTPLHWGVFVNIFSIYKYWHSDIYQQALIYITEVNIRILDMYYQLLHANTSCLESINHIMCILLFQWFISTGSKKRQLLQRYILKKLYQISITSLGKCTFAIFPHVQNSRGVKWLSSCELTNCFLAC